MELILRNNPENGPVTGDVFYARAVGSGPEGIYFKTEQGIYLVKAKNKLLDGAETGTTNKRWSFNPPINGYQPIEKLEVILSGGK